MVISNFRPYVLQRREKMFAQGARAFSCIINFPPFTGTFPEIHKNVWGSYYKNK